MSFLTFLNLARNSRLFRKNWNYLLELVIETGDSKHCDQEILF